MNAQKQRGCLFYLRGAQMCLAGGVGVHMDGKGNRFDLDEQACTAGRCHRRNQFLKQLHTREPVSTLSTPPRFHRLT